MILFDYIGIKKIYRNEKKMQRDSSTPPHAGEKTAQVSITHLYKNMGILPGHIAMLNRLHPGDTLESLSRYDGTRRVKDLLISLPIGDLWPSLLLHYVRAHQNEEQPVEKVMELMMGRKTSSAS